MVVGWVAVEVAAPALTRAQDGEWPAYAADAGSANYSPLDQTNRSNATQLRIAWRAPSIDLGIHEGTRALGAGSLFETHVGGLVR